MIVAIRIEPSRLDGEDEYVRMADMATMAKSSRNSPPPHGTT